MDLTTCQETSSRAGSQCDESLTICTGPVTFRHSLSEGNVPPSFRTTWNTSLLLNTRLWQSAFVRISNHTYSYHAVPSSKFSSMHVRLWIYAYAWQIRLMFILHSIDFEWCETLEPTGMDSSYAIAINNINCPIISYLSSWQYFMCTKITGL